MLFRSMLFRGQARKMRDIMLHTIIKIAIIAMLALFAYAGYTTISEAEAALGLAPAILG